MFFYPSGISHSFVSSTRWRKFLWVLVGALDSHRAKLRRDSITVCCRFFLYDDNSLFSCQGQRKNFFFSFLPRWWRWWRLFWQQPDICWTNTLLLRQICTFFCQNFESDAGRGVASSLLCEKNNNINEHVSKCRGIFTKDNVTQPLQKTNPDYGKWQHAIIHSCNYHFLRVIFIIQNQIVLSLTLLWWKS